jgi:hypothetical protein
MMLFACMWFMVLIAYEIRSEESTPTRFDPAGLAGDIASILAVCIGGLLAQEPGYPSKGMLSRFQTWVQNRGLTRLLVLGISVFIASLGLGASASGVNIYKGAASNINAVIGLLSLGLGAQRIAKPAVFRWFAGLILAYCSLEITYFWYRSFLDDFTKNMSPEYIFSFAAAKVALTVFFSSIVATYGMREELRGKGIVAQLRQFFSLRG